MSDSDRLNGTFGFDPADGHHHFLVIIPKGVAADQSVAVYECPRFIEGRTEGLPVAAVERVQFSLPVWKAVSEQVRAVFNLRLKEAKRKPGKWRLGPNYLAPHYGKELVLLGWALEDVAIDRADTVFRNWRGLAPEERWWLYSTANAPFSQNSKKGRGVGWRKALTIALSENPLIDVAGETGRASVVVDPIPPVAEVKSKEAPKKKSSRKRAAKKKSPDDEVTDHTRESAEPKQSDSTQQTFFDL
ncbi:DUF3780 domain-containing protein [Akkermansiaceae bacterium]|nr:DUF3780 domain-containing protein [Akkermansiaceae bacterium]